METLVLILRNIINDTVETYTYSDARLEQMITVAAQLLLAEVSFDYDYSITIGTPTITPDPVDNGDDAFIALVTLKAAALLTGAEYKIATKSSVTITDAWSTISNTGAAANYKALFDEFNKQYKETLLQHKFGNVNHIHAVLSPYTVNTRYSTPHFY
jgi:hypothetical protein